MYEVPTTSDPIDAITGLNTVIQYSPDNVTYTPFAAVGNLKAPDVKDSGRVDITVYVNPDNAEQGIPSGLKTAGQCTFDAVYNTAQHGALLDMVGVKQYFRIVLNNGDQINFQGWVASVGQPAYQNKEKVLANVGMEVTGLPKLIAYTG